MDKEHLLYIAIGINVLILFYLIYQVSIYYNIAVEYKNLYESCKNTSFYFSNPWSQ